MSKVFKAIGTAFYLGFHLRDVWKFFGHNLLNVKSFLKMKREYYDKINTNYTLETDKPTKKIFWCWLQGENNAPRLCQKCLASLRKTFPEYEIIVVTEENMFQLVKFPDYIIEKYRKGTITRTHFSDILRTALLVEYGGVWIDSTVYCTGYNIPILDYPMFVFQDWKFDFGQPTVASNWFLSAYQGHPIFHCMLDLLYKYWKENGEIENYFLFHLFFKMVTEKYSELWKQVPRFSNIPPHIMQFEMFDKYSDVRFEQIKRMSDFHKLTYKDPRLKEDLSGTMIERVME